MTTYVESLHNEMILWLKIFAKRKIPRLFKLPETTSSSVVDQLKMDTFKVKIFLSLTFLITTSVVVANQSRVRHSKDESLYYVTTAVFCIESLKIFASLGILAYQSKDICGSWLMVLKVISYNRKETLKLSVPGIIYVVQNNLGYFALTHLDSGTFEITQQIKLISTAVVMRLLMGKILSVHQWISILILLVGVCLAELDLFWPQSDLYTISKMLFKSKEGTNTSDIIRQPLDSGEFSGYAKGVAATVATAFCSSFAGVYFEKIVKSPHELNYLSQQSELTVLWIRNLQLYLFSSSFALVGCIVKDGSNILQNGFFFSYNYLVITSIVMWTVGGVMTSLTLRYLDNIYKNFSASLSIVLSSVCSFILSGKVYGLKFAAGSALVCFSLFMYYHYDSRSRNKANQKIHKNSRDCSQRLPSDAPQKGAFHHNGITSALA